jgi:hypothetical protein
MTLNGTLKTQAGAGDKNRPEGRLLLDFTGAGNRPSSRGGGFLP